MQALGSDAPDPGPTPAMVEHARQIIMNAVKGTNRWTPSAEFPTPVRWDLLDDWRRAAEDPDSEPPRWLQHGAPAGIEEEVVDMGVFPASVEDEDMAQHYSDLSESRSQLVQLDHNAMGLLGHNSDSDLTE